MVYDMTLKVKTNLAASMVRFWNGTRNPRPACIVKWPLARDVLLFSGGMAGVIHETLLSHLERPTLLILFAAMMGLPAFLQPRQEDFRKEKEEVEEKPKKQLPGESEA